jgi:hypothetical protein
MAVLRPRLLDKIREILGTSAYIRLVKHAFGEPAP